MIHRIDVHINNICNVNNKFLKYNYLGINSFKDGYNKFLSNRLINKSNDVIINIIGAEPFVDLDNLKSFISQTETLLSNFNSVNFIVNTNMSIWNDLIDGYVFNKPNLKIHINMNGLNDNNVKMFKTDGINIFNQTISNLDSIMVNHPDMNDKIKMVNITLYKENVNFFHEVFKFMRDRYNIFDYMILVDDVDIDIINDTDLNTIESNILSEDISNINIHQYTENLSQALNIGNINAAMDNVIDKIFYEFGYPHLYISPFMTKLYRKIKGVQYINAYTEYMNNTDNQSLLIECIDGTSTEISLDDIKCNIQFISYSEMDKAKSKFITNLQATDISKIMNSVVKGAKFYIINTVTKDKNMLLEEFYNEVTFITYKYNIFEIKYLNSSLNN